jgi:hypothetical protein
VPKKWLIFVASGPATGEAWKVKRTGKIRDRLNRADRTDQGDRVDRLGRTDRMDRTHEDGKGQWDRKVEGSDRKKDRQEVQMDKSGQEEARVVDRKDRKFLGNGGFYAPQPLSQHQQGTQVGKVQYFVYMIIAYTVLYSSSRKKTGYAM